MSKINILVKAICLEHIVGVLKVYVSNSKLILCKLQNKMVMGVEKCSLISCVIVSEVGNFYYVSKSILA